jgi:hypothetical protein
VGDISFGPRQYILGSESLGSHENILLWVARLPES